MEKDVVQDAETKGLPSFLSKENLKFILFGGKGGVGKTTSSTATAIYLAGTRPEKSILVFSTDPAHSLGDSFAQPINDEPTPIKGFGNLFSMEMSFQKSSVHIMKPCPY